MIWPGMGDPAKRKQTIKFLILTAILGISVATATILISAQLKENDPIYQCIDNRDTRYKISITLEVMVDNLKAEIPAGVGISENCHRALYTLSNDGVIYVEWDEEFDFQIGQFLWIWEFPHLDMDESQSKIFVNGEESPFYISSKIEDGFHYRAEFISKEYDISKERDFLPPNP